MARHTMTHEIFDFTRNLDSYIGLKYLNMVIFKLTRH
jgi:hypothetical protein